MKVVILNNRSSVTGGADRHCFDLAKELRRRGHQVAFLATDSADREECGAFIPLSVESATRDALSAVAQASVATRAFWNRSAYFATRSLIERFRPDVVHSHKLYPQLSVAPVVAVKQSNLPLVQTLHDYEFVSASPQDNTGCHIDRHQSRHRYRSLNTGLFLVKQLVHRPAVTSWVAVSRAVAATYASHGVSASPIPNCTASHPKYTCFSRRTGIIYAGRLSHEKGILDVLDVARALPETTLRIAGSGPCEPEVTAAVRELPNLEYLGPLSPSTLESALSRSLICLMPSRWEEPGPLASLEAMAAGTPIIAFDVGGLGEYVRDAGAGELVGLSAEALTRACQMLLQDEKRWALLSKNGREAVVATHSPAIYGGRILDVYHEAIAQVRCSKA